MYEFDIFELRAQRITYENARRIHEGWYGDDEDSWLCDPCVVVLDGPEPDEDHTDEPLGEWNDRTELLDDGRRGK